MTSHLTAEQRSCDVPDEGAIGMQRASIFADGGKVRIIIGDVETYIPSGS